MVYLKADGGNGFSWQKQLDYLKREDPDNLEEMTHAKLMALKQQQPDKADYYEDLDNLLTDLINDAIDETPEFGYDHAQAIVRDFLTENDLLSFLEEPETRTYSYWCHHCDDFMPQKLLESGNTYCLNCHRERASALTRPMPDDKRPEVENTRFVVTGYYNDRSYYLAEGGKWSRFTFQAKQFNDKREALEARETTPRPVNDFYPGLLQLDDRDQDFIFNEDETLTVEDEIFDYLTAKEDFDEWEPQSPDQTPDPVVTPRLFGERQTPGLAALHDAIASMSNPDGTFRWEGGDIDEL